MSHTNVDIADRLEERKRFAMLEAERKFWAEAAFALQQELENIPRAIRDWGYIEIDGLTLIAKPDEDAA